MKTHLFCISFFSLILASCGSSDETPFTGPTKSVPENAITLTAENALDTIKATISALDLILLPVDTIANSYSKIRSNAPNTPIKSSSNNTKKTHYNTAIAFKPIDITQTCDSGGSIRTAGDYSFTKTSENGEVNITSINCTFTESTVSGVIKSVFSNNIDSNLQSSGSRTDTAAMITVTLNNQTHTLLSYQNTSIFNNASQLSEDLQAFSFSSPLIGGGILLEDTLSWRQRFNDFFAYQGTTLISGASNSKIIFTALDNTQFQLQVDENGDGTYEIKQVYSWIVLIDV